MTSSLPLSASVVSSSLCDEEGARPVRAHRTVYEGMVWNIGRDTIDFAAGVSFDREYVDHTGAVAVLAFTPAQDGKMPEVIVIRQYRHPAARTMWEIPAGLLDQGAEDPAAAALRELEEETGYTSAKVEPLLSFFPSPGGSNELIHLFVAHECTRIDVDFVREFEEAEIEVRTVPFATLLEAALASKLRNGTLLTAVFAYASRSQSQRVG